MEIEADEKEPAMDVDNKGKEFKKMEAELLTTLI